MPDYEKETTEQQRLEKQLEDLGTVWRTRAPMPSTA